MNQWELAVELVTQMNQMTKKILFFLVSESFKLKFVHRIKLYITSVTSE